MENISTKRFALLGKLERELQEMFITNQQCKLDNKPIAYNQKQLLDIAGQMRKIAYATDGEISKI